MKLLIIATVAAVACVSLTTPFAHAKEPACEDTLKQLRTEESGAKLTAENLKAVDDLKAKGVERCNADDDKRANQFFNDALKIIHPK